MIAVTTEGWIVVAFATAIVGVSLTLFATRDRSPHADLDARWVKLSAPASLVGVVAGAALLLVGLDFVRLGPSGDADGAPVSAPTTTPGTALAPVERPTSTTSTTWPVVDEATSFGYWNDDGIWHDGHPPVLAATGSGLTVLSGVGVLLVSAGVRLRRISA